ncbi:hypothetical protein [Nocardioides bruguierae]|uniref:Uncharacterized protein n=1 Tax=Nocardioides bruguierae TaxID=2945102 RepID=A0A9X2IDR9_9ACTN|nr:hypothetical protein [Nocardioides bruguierae]MCM0619313.1 hypothetical protein [Nocardioides bruguierae]
MNADFLARQQIAARVDDAARRRRDHDLSRAQRFARRASRAAAAARADLSRAL